MLNILKEECQEEERRTLNDLMTCIDQKKSLLFNAGAGAGKTYALVECLKYVCKKKIDALKYHNQQVVCITYTNVAANEIKNRLGNTDVVLVSTIHERLWEIIRDYQEELLNIHLENLNVQIVELNEKINSNDDYLSLTECQREQLKELLPEKEKEFYEIYDLKAKEFRDQFGHIFASVELTIKNVGEFKKTCSQLIKIHKYQKCISAISNGESGYTEVKYDARGNKDYLHHMKISHDTLLKYSERMISKYKDLRRFIVDKYPYFFVDEYQDTNEIVIRILSEIENYANEIKHPIFVGYFGDSAQNIYDDGIGGMIEEYCEDYEHINKLVNRRSCEEVIVLANKIRNDNLEQRSIYKDSTGGSVKVYYGTESDAENFIRVNSVELQKMAVGDKSVHCFLLMNKIVAEHAGIEELYDWFSATPFYKQNFDLLATELLSNDVNRLGEIQRYLYNLTDFFSLSEMDDTSLLDVLPNELLTSLDMDSVTKIVELLKCMTAPSLENMVHAIDLLKMNLTRVLQGKKGIALIDNAIDSITGIENFSLEQFKIRVEDALFQNEENATDQISKFMNMPKNLLFKWYQYINRNYNDDVIYHTFHGTKGLEFDNVIMVFGDSFGNKSRLFFNNYFKMYGDEHKERDQNIDYVKARNLLYVAATRARCNLRILYTGDYQGNKNTVDNIFENISLWEQ